MVNRSLIPGQEQTRRLIVFLLALVLFEFAANAVGPLVAVNGQRYLMAGCAVGLLLALVIGWRDIGSFGRTLALVTEVAAPLTGWALLLWPENTSGRTAGLIVEQSGNVPASPSVYFALGAAGVALASCCGWLLFQRYPDGPRPWPAVALLGSAFLIRADVTRVYEDRFPLFFLGAVALVVCVYAPSPRRLLLVIPTLALAASLLLITWGLPTARTDWSLGVGDPVVSLAGNAGAPGSSQSLSLAGAFHPSNRVVMSISINRPDLHPYWATSIFDYYDGQSWKSSANVHRSFLPAQPMSTAPTQNTIGLATTVQVIEPTDALVSVGTPFSSSLPAVGWYTQGERYPFAIRAPQELPGGTIYEIDSTLGSPPPARVATFLQLPPEPPSLRRLARRIAAGRTSPLAEALALQHFLRDSGRFRYDVSAGSPPGQDAVVNFLFQSHRGYCTQFASSLVVLARELGIPARLVSGYASGEQFLQNFTVRERDAHSWAQVLVPGQGWISLDPTPGFQQYPTQLPGTIRAQPVLQAPGAPTVKAGAPSLGAGWGRSHSYHPTRAGRSTPTRGPSTPPISVAALAFFLLLALGGLLIYTVRPRSLAQLYASMVRATPRRFGRINRHETPLEYAERFREQLQEYTDVRLVVELYARQRYARVEPSDAELREARRSWRRLHRTWLVQRLHP